MPSKRHCSAGAEEGLVVVEQDLVDIVNIVVARGDKILDDDVEFLAPREGVACPGQEVICFVEVQL